MTNLLAKPKIHDREHTVGRSPHTIEVAIPSEGAEALAFCLIMAGIPVRSEFNPKRRIKIIMSDNLIYKVVFINQNQVYEMYAKRVFQGEMFGFVVIEDFVFGETSSVVVDPYEEKLKAEFANVRRSFIPMHEIIRIDQVERRGTAKIIPLDREAGQSNKVTKFYVPDKS